MTEKTQRTALALVHSNTGNTAMLAREAVQTLEALGWKAECVPLEKAHEGLPKGKPDLLLVGSPIHFWQTPVPVVGMIRKLPDFRGAAAFVFMTYGTVFDGDAPYQLALEVEKRGARVLGGASVLAPHNFKISPTQRLGDAFDDFGRGQPDPETLENFRAAVRSAAAKAENNVNGFDIRSLRSPKPVITFLDGLLPVSVQRNALPKAQWNETLCVGCGKCVKKCTTGSIQVQDGKIVTNHNTCFRCYQCLWTCEFQARTANLAPMAKILRGLKKVVKNPGTRFFA